MAAGISPALGRDDEVARRRREATRLSEEFRTLAARTHAAMAELARLAKRLDAVDGWCGVGLRSFGDWASLNTGVAPRTGAHLLAVGTALRELPAIRAAFASGRLSFDSVRALVSVATAADEGLWLELAASATGAQLARICRASRKVLDLDTPAHADEQLSRRGLWAQFDDDGMLRLRALLLPEEGALVRAAIEAALEPPAPESGKSADASAADVCADPADDSLAARRADALVAVCEHALAADGALGSDPAALPLLVHVDVGVLTGQDPDGRRHVEGGPALSLSTARRLGCDASVITITERDGLPINVGPRRRTMPRALRRAVQGRDRTCRFPGCAVAAQRGHVHHVRHWAEGGANHRHNLVALCHFHHRRVHDGTIVVAATDDGDFAFTTAGGAPIPPPPPRSLPEGVPPAAVLDAALDPATTRAITPTTATPVHVTDRMDLDYVVSVMLDTVERVRGRAKAV